MCVLMSICLIIAQLDNKEAILIYEACQMLEKLYAMLDVLFKISSFNEIILQLAKLPNIFIFIFVEASC